MKTFPELTETDILAQIKDTYRIKLRPLYWEDREVDDEPVLYFALIAIFRELSQDTLTPAALNPDNRFFTAGQRTLAAQIYEVFTQYSAKIINESEDVEPWIKTAALQELNILVNFDPSEIHRTHSLMNHAVILDMDKPVL